MNIFVAQTITNVGQLFDTTFIGFEDYWTTVSSSPVVLQIHSLYQYLYCWTLPDKCFSGPYFLMQTHSPCHSDLSSRVI